jgi:hypothetical protein
MNLTDFTYLYLVANLDWYERMVKLEGGIDNRRYRSELDGYFKRNEPMSPEARKFTLEMLYGDEDWIEGYRQAMWKGYPLILPLFDIIMVPQRLAALRVIRELESR